MPQLENYPNNDGIILPMSAENRFQKAVRSVFGVGKNRIKDSMMIKPGPGNTSKFPDFQKGPKSKTVPSSLTAAVRG